MPRVTTIKPTHKAIRQYYQTLQSYSDHHVRHEGALETAFQRLLADTARQHGWTLISKQKLRVGKKNVFPDGTLRDLFFARRGFWEAKDTDDLDAEIAKKRAKGYPLSNIVFEDTRRAAFDDFFGLLLASCSRYPCLLLSQRPCIVCRTKGTCS